MSIILLSREVSQKTTDTVELISIAAVAALILMLFVIAIKHKSSTRSIAFAGISVAASFVLSFIKITPVVYGGSITLASFVPILIYAYCYGLSRGLVAGIVFGLLNFIQGPYILVPETFLLDYILAFGAIGLMGLAPKFTAKAGKNIVLGTLLVYFVRLTSHVLSGIIYFNSGWVADGFPVSSAFVYSLAYNCVYIIPDLLICLTAFIALIATKNFNKILDAVK